MAKRTVKITPDGAASITTQPYECEKKQRQKGDQVAAQSWKTTKQPKEPKTNKGGEK